jgi:hypothetical protein
MRGASVALVSWLFVGRAGHAQGQTPFGRLAGQWSGSGTIQLAEDRASKLSAERLTTS